MFICKKSVGQESYVRNKHYGIERRIVNILKITLCPSRTHKHRQKLVIHSCYFVALVMILILEK